MQPTSCYTREEEDGGDSDRYSDAAGVERREDRRGIDAVMMRSRAETWIAARRS
jgi:hypothetical protein